MSEQGETTTAATASEAVEATAPGTAPVAAGATASADPAGQAPALTGETLAKVREYVVRANPEAVPELIAGGSLEEIEASVPVAKAAYERIATAARAGAEQGAGGQGNPVSAAIQQAAQQQPPVVPAGGATVVVDPANIPSGEKIRLGLQGERR